VMSDGVIEQIGTPEVIYHHPSSLFVAGFIGFANLLPGTVTGNDGDEAVVDLVGGATIRASAPTPPAVGSQVSLMLRPERLQVAARDGIDSHDGRRLAGKVSQVIFQGAAVRLAVVLGDGTEVVTLIDPDEELPFLRPGDAVGVSWRPDAGFLLQGWPARAGASSTDVDQVEAAL
jgi:spermidine/putrescine transport system ATP-binding protein